MRTTPITRRIFSVLLCLSILLMNINGLVMTASEPGAGKTAGTGMHTADAGTLDTYINALNIKENSQNAGRVWADKSVFTDAQITVDKAVVNGVTVDDGITVSNDSDFMHIFSTIGSSSEIYQDNIPADIVFVLDFSASMYTGIDRLIKTLEAVNNALNTIAEKSPNSRVGIVVYSSKAVELLPLVKLVPDAGAAKTDWFAGSTPNSSGLSGEIKFTGNVQTAAAADKWSAKQLTTSSVLIGQGDAGIGAQTNLQAGIALGMDMLATEGVTKWYSQKSEETYNRIPAIIIMTDGECNLLTQSSDGKQENAWWNSKTDSQYNQYVDEELSGIAPIVTSTLLTAAYNMTRIYDNYFDYYNENAQLTGDEHVYAYGISIDTNNVATARQKIHSILDPSNNFNANTGDHTALPGVTLSGERITDAYNALKQAIEDKNVTSFSPGKIIDQNLGDQINKDYTYVDVTINFGDLKDHTKEQIWDNINYTDAFYDIDNEDQNRVFDQIVKDIIHVNMFRPVSGTNDVNLDNVLTYVDPIGKYMEIKDIKLLSLFGETYEIVKDGTPVYYNQYGEVIENEEEIINRNYAYEQQNYRIKTGNDIIENPCYSDEEHQVYFDLSQIKIYTKTTWDFRDPDIEDGNIQADTGGDQSLYINIPALALPVQKATVQLDLNGNIVSYETNLPDENVDLSDDEAVAAYKANKAQSTPLRVFYTVGVADEVKTDPTDPNSAVDLAKLSSDYVAANKDPLTGEVYLYSNWYNSSKPNYTHYVTGEDTGYTFGDAVITFSPDTDNSYYRYQEYLPVYAAADAGTQTITDINPEGWYHIVIGYYTSECEYVESVVVRKGAEFGSGIGGAGFGEYLSWYDPDTGDVKPYTEGSTPPASGYVLAARKGGVSIGDMSKNIGMKGANNIGANNTGTAETYYMPTISDSTSGDVLIVNIYLGNNGRLPVVDTQILVTKTVSRIGAEDDYILGEDFHYSVEFSGITEPVSISAIKVSAAGKNNWRARIKSIELLTNNQGLLLKEGGALAAYTYQNRQYYVFVGGDSEDQSFTHTIFEKKENENNSLDELLGGKNTAKLNVAAYLLPVDKYTADWYYSEYDRDLVAIESFEVGTINTNKPIGYEIEIPDYQSSTIYDYTELRFDENGRAEFDLKAGEGILILGLDAETEYKVTEILSLEQAGAKGILLQSVEHVMDKDTALMHYGTGDKNGSDFSFVYDDHSDSVCGAEHKYSVWGSTGIDCRREANYCNYVPKAEKTLVSSDNDLVNVGDILEYELYWENYCPNPAKPGEHLKANVVITDELDQGVDFISAEYGGVVLSAPAKSITGTTADGESVTITYENRTVKWQIPDTDGGKFGYVHLKVAVNDKAIFDFDNDSAGTVYDYEIKNQGRMSIDGRYFVDTNIVKSPVTNVHKTETEIKPYGDTEFTPVGENDLVYDPVSDSYVGLKVGEGTQIRYKITFSNYNAETGEDGEPNEPTTIVIKDRLDPDVSFVSAQYKDAVLDVYDNSDKNGVKQQAGNDVSATITYYSSGTVEWKLENVPYHSSGEVYVTVQVTAERSDSGNTEGGNTGGNTEGNTGSGGGQTGGSTAGGDVDNTKEWGTLQFEKVDITDNTVPEGKYIIVYTGSGDYAYLGNDVTNASNATKTDYFISGTKDNNIVVSADGSTVTLKRSSLSYDPEVLIWTVEHTDPVPSIYLKNDHNDRYLNGYNYDFTQTNPDYKGHALNLGNKSTVWSYTGGKLSSNGGGYFGYVPGSGQYRVEIGSGQVSGMEFYKLKEVSDHIDTEEVKEVYFPDREYTFTNDTRFIYEYLEGEAAVLVDGAYVIGELYSNLTYYALNNKITSYAGTNNAFLTAQFTASASKTTEVKWNVTNGENKNIIWLVEYDDGADYTNAEYFYLRSAENSEYLSYSSNSGFSYVPTKTEAAKWYVNIKNNYHLNIYNTGTVIGTNMSWYFSTSPYTFANRITKYFRTDRPTPAVPPPPLPNLPDEPEPDEPVGIGGDYKIKNTASVKVNSDPKLTTETVENPMAGELIVEKQLYGTVHNADLTQDFEFAVKLTSTDAEFDPSKLAVIRTNGTKSEQLNVIWENNQCKFTLKAGEAVHIVGINCDVAYTVTEADTEHYTLHHATRDGKAVNDLEDSTVTGNIDLQSGMTAKVVFYNESGLVSLPNYGGIGTALYYLLGGLLICGAVLLLVIVRKRRVSVSC